MEKQSSCILTPAAAKARFGPWTPLDLRVLGPYFDPVLYQHVREAAQARYDTPNADGITGTITISAAISTYQQDGPTVAHLQEELQGGVVVGGRIEGIASALHRPRILEDVRRRMTSTGSANHHG